MNDMSDSDASSTDDRWDAALLAAGFDVDPDRELNGRAADEAQLAADAEMGDGRDPWADASPTVDALTDAQREYVIAASPALGAALPSQSLLGDDPLDGLADADVAHADADVIDFD